MKITKFAQSCILIESNNEKILVDPGSILFDESLLVEYWNEIDIILVTHKHADHFCTSAISEMLKNTKTKLYSSSEVARAYPEINVNIVKVGDEITGDDYKIEVVNSVHGYMPFLKGDSEVSEGLGYIVEIEGKRIYSVGDSICFKNDYKCDILCVPVSGHGLVMGTFEAALYAKEVEASLIIPVHMDNPRFPVDLELSKGDFEGLDCKVLGNKESLVI